MREKLQEIEEDRDVFFGTFQRMGAKGSFKGHKQRTILLIDIKNANKEPMTDHAWFNYTKGFEDLGQLQPGDEIRFRARVKEYRKGSVRRGKKVEYDYKLSHPSQVTLVYKTNYKSIPTDFFTGNKTYGSQTNNPTISKAGHSNPSYKKLDKNSYPPCDTKTSFLKEKESLIQTRDEIKKEGMNINEEKHKVKDAFKKLILPHGKIKSSNHFAPPSLLNQPQTHQQQSLSNFINQGKSKSNGIFILECRNKPRQSKLDGFFNNKI